MLTTPTQHVPIKRLTSSALARLRIPLTSTQCVAPCCITISGSARASSVFMIPQREGTSPINLFICVRHRAERARVAKEFSTPWRATSARGVDRGRGLPRSPRHSGLSVSQPESHAPLSQLSQTLSQALHWLPPHTYSKGSGEWADSPVSLESRLRLLQDTAYVAFAP
jgi:hypothetical protein